MTDAGTRVPLLIRWPQGGLSGIVKDDLIGFADFYATFSDLVHKEEFNDGKSFLPIIKGEKYQPRETLTMSYDPHWGHNDQYRGRFVRDKRYKLYQDGRFYDLMTDSEEETPRSLQDLTEEEKVVWKKLNAVQEKYPVWK